jgi:hypothetical protein
MRFRWGENPGLQSGFVQYNHKGLGKGEKEIGEFVFEWAENCQKSRNTDSIWKLQT